MRFTLPIKVILRYININTKMINIIIIGGSDLCDNMYRNKSLGTIRVKEMIIIQYIVKNILFFSFISEWEVLTMWYSPKVTNISISSIHWINNILSTLDDIPIMDTCFNIWNSGYLNINDNLYPSIPMMFRFIHNKDIIDNI